MGLAGSRTQRNIKKWLVKFGSCTEYEIYNVSVMIEEIGLVSQSLALPLTPDFRGQLGILTSWPLWH